MSEKAKAVLSTMYADKPLILGHRGASADSPMNRLPAFELALEQGTDGIERAAELVNLGVDGLITDMPGAMRAAFA